MGRKDVTVDRDGKTLDEFLRDYDVTKYFRPSVTVDAVLLIRSARGGRVLLIRRGGHPYIGGWAFPGGFVEQNESCEDAAVRELYEETGIRGVPLRQAVTVSTPGRDPRWRNITVVYTAALDGAIPATGMDDAAEARWFDFTVDIIGDEATVRFTGGGESFCERLRICRDGFGKIDINGTVVTERGKIAFDHAKLVCYLYEEFLT